jgi:hypothetical protein
MLYVAMTRVRGRQDIRFLTAEASRAKACITVRNVVIAALSKPGRIDLGFASKDLAEAASLDLGLAVRRFERYEIAPDGARTERKHMGKMVGSKVRDIGAIEARKREREEEESPSSLQRKRNRVGATLDGWRFADKGMEGAAYGELGAEFGGKGEGEWNQEGAKFGKKGAQFGEKGRGEWNQKGANSGEKGRGEWNEKGAHFGEKGRGEWNNKGADYGQEGAHFGQEGAHFGQKGAQHGAKGGEYGRKGGRPKKKARGRPPKDPNTGNTD